MHLAQNIRNTGVVWWVIRVVTFLGAIGRDYPEILKYGAVFNVLRLKPEGATHLRTTGALKIKSAQ